MNEEVYHSAKHSEKADIHRTSSIDENCGMPHWTRYGLFPKRQERNQAVHAQ